MTVDNSPYFSKRDIFYYLEVTDKQKQRDNIIASILDEPTHRMYVGLHSNSDSLQATTDLKYVRYFKDKRAANNFTSNAFTKVQVCEMDAETFINTIPDNYEISNFITKRNLKLKREMSKSMKVWSEHRKKYKAISAYKRVPDPSNWLPCKDCGLIPLVWEYNNGRSTACGCGRDEYEHHSIHAESIMSHIKRNNGSASGFNSSELRMNWNQWVTCGQDVFKQIKSTNKEIW